MADLQRQAHKIAEDATHTERMLANDDETSLRLALASAKRVRRDATLLVRALASARDDKRYSQEAQANGRK